MAPVQICVFNPVTTYIDQVVAASVGPGVAGQPVVLNSLGLIDPSLFGQGGSSVIAGQNLSAGNLVNLYSQGGTLHAQLAYAQTTPPAATAPSGASYPLPAFGFVSSQIFTGGNGTVSFSGTFVYIDGNSEFTSSDIGSIVFLSAVTPGGVTKTPPTGVEAGSPPLSQLDQSVGYVVGFTLPNLVTVAFSAAFLDFMQINGVLPISKGGTNSTTAAGALINLIGGSPSSGNVLVWNGSAWVPSTNSPTIGGSIAATQIAYGSTTNAITGSADLTYAPPTLTIRNTAGINTTASTITKDTFDNLFVSTGGAQLILAANGNANLQAGAGSPELILPANGQIQLVGLNTGVVTFLEGTAGFQGGDNQIVFDLYQTGGPPHGVWFKDDGSRASVFLNTAFGDVYMQNILGQNAPLTQVTVAGSPPATATYTGTLASGSNNSLVGLTAVITGFLNTGNNVTAVITASNSLSFTVAYTTQIPEIDAGHALINMVSPSLVFAGSVWTGSAFTDDLWTITGVPGSGSNPTSSLTFAHPAGGTGTAGVAIAVGGTTLPAQSGALRLENNQFIGWRNTENNGELFAGYNSGNQFVASNILTNDFLSTGPIVYYGINQIATATYPISSVASAIGNTTTYTGTFGSSAGPVEPGEIIQVLGFTHPSNNGYFYVVSTNGGVTPTLVTVNNALGVAEVTPSTMFTYAYYQGSTSSAGAIESLGQGSGSIAIGASTYKAAFGAVPNQGTIGLLLSRSGDPLDVTLLDSFLTDQNNRGFKLTQVTGGLGFNPAVFEMGILGGEPGLLIALQDSVTGISATGTGVTSSTSFGTVTLSANGFAGSPPVSSVTTFTVSGDPSATLANSSVATSISNQVNAPSLKFQGSFWNNTLLAAVPDVFSFDLTNLGNVLPSQASSTLTLNHTGSNIAYFTMGPQIFRFTSAGENVLGTVSVGDLSVETEQSNGTVFPLTAAANAVGSTTTYTGSITVVLPQAGAYLTIAGFTNPGNNGRFIVQSSTSGLLTGTVTVYNPNGIAESATASLTFDTQGWSAGNIASEGYGFSTSATIPGQAPGTFKINGTAHAVTMGSQAEPGVVPFVITMAGNATDAGFMRIVNYGDTGNHGMEIGAVIGGSTGSPPSEANAVILHLGNFSGGRNAYFDARLLAGGTPLNSTDVVLSSNWGSAAGSPPIGAPLAVINGYDSAFTITITAGAVLTAANPTFTITFADGAFLNTPIILCQQIGGDDVVSFVTVTPSTTAPVFTWNSTPNPGSTYIFNVLVKGLA